MDNKIVVKKKDAIKREFKGVRLDSLAVGERSMVTKMNYVVGNYAAEHTHPQEQCGYVISGEYLLTVENREFVLEPGDSYAIPGNVPHSFKVLKAGEVVDVFTPVSYTHLNGIFRFSPGNAQNGRPKAKRKLIDTNPIFLSKQEMTQLMK